MTHKESDDSYHAVVAQLHPGWRVIACRDGIQWILQRLKGRGASAWRGICFCRTRDALMRCIRERDIDVSAEAVAIIANLPVRL
ncbi:hypothetical protein JYP52_02495 [Nitratireductor aquibiodomus]|uniref:hypothetical protein n=1 Tax=Nitratireductor aquibiodomus TaxID=204799 RepID=UPI0019D37863|nr:hypothetical protein [Nitratireductor aquibiodomus]MBN7759991.1 hypothetical protein [Nitratireductor aquibiodomus]